MPIKPSYLIFTGAGVIVAVSGLKGWKIGGTVRDVISGKNPAANPQLTAQISGTQANYAYGMPGSAHGNIANIAASLIGFPYLWGGAPANGSGDCSSFVNWVIGKQARLAIPGYKPGTYTGKTHGPNTLAWLAWIGTGLVHIHRSQAQAGDLVIWQTHMGIITDNGQHMISDLNPSLGTQQTTINGGGPGFPEIPVFARLR